MYSPEEEKGAQAPEGGSTSSTADKPGVETPPEEQAAYQDENSYGDGYPYEEDPYANDEPAPPSASVSVDEPPAVEKALAPAAAAGNIAPPAPPTPPPSDEDEDGDDGMLRMSFLEHLEELRSRIIKALAGIGIAFVLSLTFTRDLWEFVSGPAVDALESLGYQPMLAQITPMESFNTIYIKLPILCAIFLSSPWILYQVWAFIAPGLYRRERRWAAPFVICSAGLFIAGGVFAYFVAFRFGLTFLLGIGRGINVLPVVSISEYFNLFVNVTLGVGLVFELPVLVFFLTLLRVVTPRFLISNSRYAILIIFLLAAIVTPTPDVFNLMIFATPMVLLFYVGVFASYLLVLQREDRKFPWRKAITFVTVVLLLLGTALYLAITRYGFKLVPQWPFLIR
jgi:sec-independent protein translocase protein TatC